MTDELKEAIESLREISPKLNAATDDANRVVAMVEKFLGEECSIGVEAKVHIDEESLPDNESKDLWLHYCRIASKFQFAVEVTVYNNGTDESRREYFGSWSQAPRALRLRTFPRIPKLLKEISETAKTTTKKVEESGKAVESVLKALKG